MAEDTIKHLTFGLILTAIMAWILFSFLIGGASEYGVDSSEFGGEKYNFTGFNDSLQDINTTASNFKQTYEDWGILSIPLGILTFVKQLFIFLFTPFQLISNLAYRVLGIPSIILNAIWGLLVLTIGFGIWRLWKQGD